MIVIIISQRLCELKRSTTCKNVLSDVTIICSVKLINEPIGKALRGGTQDW